jgi:NADH-quinone oxidoreductase subunit J
MNTLFFVTGALVVVSAAMAVSRLNAVHALLYLVVSFIGLGLVFFLLGSPFAAVLEVIIYAGAIMVLFVFVIMMFNIRGLWSEERGLLQAGAWVGPVFLVLILAAEIIYVLWSASQGPYRTSVVGPKAVSASLFGPYVLAVELASMLLLAGLAGACHLARRSGPAGEREGELHE